MIVWGRREEHCMQRKQRVECKGPEAAAGVFKEELEARVAGAGEQGEEE